MTKYILMLFLCSHLICSHSAYANSNAQNSQGSTQSSEPSSEENPPPANPHDPENPTLIEGVTPNDSELSLANLELLAKNTELERQIDTLTTQNNVLVQERSGQLFLYGAMTAIFSMMVGFVLAKLISPRKDRW